MKLEIVGYKICPYVQKVLIALNYKALAYEYIEIDLNAKPTWFLKKSPMGKVPLLIAEDQVLFESGAIIDYLDDMFEPRLRSDLPIEAAQERAWAFYSNEVIVQQIEIQRATKRVDYLLACETYLSKLKPLENHIKGRFFFGNTMSLVDCHFAPAFIRLYYILGRDEQLASIISEQLPKISAWIGNVMHQKCVIDAITPDFSYLLSKRLAGYDSYLLKLEHSIDNELVTY